MREPISTNCNCESCGNGIVIRIDFFPHIHDDAGGLILKCSKCGHVFEEHVSHDVTHAKTIEGAKILDTDYFKPGTEVKRSSGMG